MEEKNRPLGREKNVTTGGGNASKRGEGLGTGPVGNTNGYSSRKEGGSSGSAGSSGSPKRSTGKGLGVGAIAVILVILFICKNLFSCGGGSSSSGDVPDLSAPEVTQQSSSSDNVQTSSGASSYETTAEEYSAAVSAPSTASYVATAGESDNTVASGTRAKRTQILGNGSDVVTILVYMCGTDLESKHGMATSDLTEMCKATIGSNINLLVYTGGCKGWKNSNISSSHNQIYQIKNGGLSCIESDMGSDSMTKPETLTTFINYGRKYYPANRLCLIFWDHGGGSLSGFGYDENNKNSGSMTLAGINTALKNSGATFDFIGFDACLMATVENALMLSDYADYMIASEETEPGVGWYYTNWLTRLSADTSMSTVAIGKNIIDDKYCE